MPTTQYKEARICACGYTTMTITYWSRHKKSCKLVKCDKDELIEQMKQQLADTKEQLVAKDEQIKELIIRLSEVHTPPPVRAGGAKGTKRKRMTEPQRRKIALRQNFKCANPDGKCKLTDALEEYDVDHVIPLFLGGDDEERNMQALCPACHRRKTENEALQAPSGPSSELILGVCG